MSIVGSLFHGVGQVLMVCVIYENVYIGKYKLIETNTLQGYIFDKKDYFIEINQNDKTKEITIKNQLEKTIIEVPSTGRNDYYITEIIGTISIILGVILIGAKKS